MELYKFLSGIIYKIGIRDGFLFENPEFSFKKSYFVCTVIFRILLFKNFKSTVYASSFLLFFLSVYSTFKYRNNFHFSPNCEIYEIYKSGDNPYNWDRFGWDVLHPPNILKFYALPCELFNSFKIMNLVFLFLLIFTMIYVNSKRLHGVTETLFELTFLLSILRIYEGHAYLYILPFAYFSLKNVFNNENKWSFFVLGFVFGFRVIPFLLLIPFIYKFHKKYSFCFLIGGLVPFLPTTKLDINIYSSFIENIVSQRILTLSNSYFVQNIWNLEIFSILNNITKYTIYLIVAYFLMWLAFKNKSKTIIYAVMPLIISLSPRAVPYEMFILLPFFNEIYKKHFFVYFYFLSFSIQIFFIVGSMCGVDSFLNISSIIFHITSVLMIIRRDKIDKK